MTSTRFTLCQTVIRNNLQKSSNNEVVRIYYDTNCDTILQYDQFKSTKEVITQYRKNKEDGITTVSIKNAKPRNKINMGAWNEISC